MNGPMLIAETPRAANDRHAFLIPRGASLDENTVRGYMAAASRQKEGPDYISDSRLVKQSLANGSVREGCERLVLIGVDASKISKIQGEIEHVRKFLREKLMLLGECATEISRARAERSTLIQIDELGAWSSDETLSQLPALRTREDSIGPSASQSSRKSKRGSFLGALVGVTLFGLLLLFMRYQSLQKEDATQRQAAGVESAEDRSQRSSGNLGGSVLSSILKAWWGENTPAGSSKSKTMQDEQRQIEKSLTELSKDWGRDPETLSKSIGIAVGWDRGPRNKAELISRMSSDSIFREQVEAFQKAPTKRGTWTCFLKTERPSEATVIEEIVADGGKKRALALRERLFSFYTESSNLRNRSQDSLQRAIAPEQNQADPGGASKGADPKDVPQNSGRAFGELIKKIHDFKPSESGFGAHFAQPSTPVFDRQDAMIIRYVNELVNGEEVKKALTNVLEPKFRKQFEGTSELAIQLRSFSNSDEDVVKGCTKEGDDLIRETPDEKTRNEIDIVYAVGRRLLGSLCQINPPLGQTAHAQYRAGRDANGAAGQ